MMSRNRSRNTAKSKDRYTRLQSRLVAWMLVFTLLGPAWLPAAPARSAENMGLKSLRMAKMNFRHPAPENRHIVIAHSYAAPARLFLELDEAQPAVPWRWNPPGEVIAPILLYHHVGENENSSRYIVSVRDFEAQMRSLRQWGYTTIPLSLLVQALTGGAMLPPKPIVISFDDGYMDIYRNAFPVLQENGFTGIAYIITDQLEIGGYMHTAEMKNLLGAGWEIGSHTQTHTSLRASQVDLQGEIFDSRRWLETDLGEVVSSFSFPYGLTSPYATLLVRDTGYTSAVGLGGFYRHSLKTQFYLSRIEIRGDTSLHDFASLLPWAGETGSQAVEPESPHGDVQ